MKDLEVGKGVSFIRSYDTNDPCENPEFMAIPMGSVGEIVELNEGNTLVRVAVYRHEGEERHGLVRLYPDAAGKYPIEPLPDLSKYGRQLDPRDFDDTLAGRPDSFLDLTDDQVQAVNDAWPEGF